MSLPVRARELSLGAFGWVQISENVGSDPALMDLEDAKLLLPALGLMVAAIAACVGKDDTFLSKSEMFRTVVPGADQASLEAALEALASVGLVIEATQNGRPGWEVGCEGLIAEKAKRVGRARDAADKRWADIAAAKKAAKEAAKAAEAPAKTMPSDQKAKPSVVAPPPMSPTSKSPDHPVGISSMDDDDETPF